MEYFFNSEYLEYGSVIFLLGKCNLLLYNQVFLPAKESQGHQDFLYPVLLIHTCKNRIMIRFCQYEKRAKQIYIEFINIQIFLFQSYFSFISSNSFRYSWIFNGSRYFKVDPLILFRSSFLRNRWNIWRILFEIY